MADYGSVANLALAGAVFLVTLVLNQYARGFLSYGSMRYLGVPGIRCGTGGGSGDILAASVGHHQ